VFSNSELLHSNLGGMGPDTTAPPTIRYVNAGTVYHPILGSINVDLEVINRSTYVPFDPSLNTIVNQQFAQISLACNEAVDLRVSVLQSCTSGSSCLGCTGLTGAERVICYASGCDCWGTTVFNEASCSGTELQDKKTNYGCSQMNETVTFPSDAYITVSVFDLDSGVGCSAVEQLTVPEYEYAVTPLRPSSGNTVTSSLYENKAAHSLTSTSCAVGTPPTDPLNLTDDQASKGVQIFVPPDDAIIDATYSITSSSSSCTGGTLLFAGESFLCNPPPPPPPPSPPPPSPPPPSPPSSPPTPPSSPPPSPFSPPPCGLEFAALASGGRDSSNLLVYSVVVLEDAILSSHTHDGPIAVGGRLTDGTPQQSATVSGHSYVGSLRYPNLFHFSAGVTMGQSNFPFDWSYLEYIATNAAPTTANDYYKVNVRCSGGNINMMDFMSTTYSGTSGFNVLIIFNTADTVIIDANAYGRTLSASILAPFSHVQVEAGAQFVDGFIVAKSLSMDDDGGSLQMHAHGYSGPLQCSGGSTCQAPPTGAASCSDLKGTRRCLRKRAKGRCSKPRVRTVKCRKSCGACDAGFIAG